MGRGAFVLLAILLAACNMSIPQVTPTVRPTLTPSETPFFTSTSTLSPTFTDTATSTMTPTASDTVTPAPTDTPQPSATFTDTETATATETPSETPTQTFTPSDTATGTPPPTDTPTETFTPSNTPSETPTETFTPTNTPTDTPVPSATLTASPTETLTPLPSDTFTPTFTVPPTDTFTPKPTFTPTPTDTEPPPTPLPTIGPTETFTPSNTPTDTLVPTATDTLTPSSTFTPQIVTGENTLVPIGERPELTLTLVATPTNTPGEPPTQDVTPTIFTAAPGTEVASIFTVTPDLTTPQFATIQVTPLEAVSTPSPFPTPPTLEVINPTLLPTPIPFDPSTRSFALSTVSGGVSSSAFSLPGGAETFARNPQDPNRYATVDTRGLLYLVNDFAGGGRDRMIFAPFSVSEPPSAELNNANITQVAWSPNGVYLAYLIDTDYDDIRDNDLYNDGVWYMEPQRVTETDPTYQLLRDCPPEPSCSIVLRENEPYRYRSLSFEWNYQSNGILIRVQLPDEGREAFIVVAVPGQDPNVRPNVNRYDYASWSQDGNSIVVSGRSADGQTVAVGRVDRSGNLLDFIPAGQIGLGWIQNAVERPNGQVVMLGTSGGHGSPLALYDVSGTALTSTIGNAAPERVDWSPDRSAVLLVIPEGELRRYYVAQVNGSVREITAEVAGALAVEWVQGQPPASAPTPQTNPLAPETPQFTAGQQVRVVAQWLNLRQDPSTLNEPLGVVNFGDTLTILGEPVQAEGLTWYPVITADGRTGYVAASVGDVPGISA